MFKADWPVLVVPPSSARYHWQAEFCNILVTTGLLIPADILLIDKPIPIGTLEKLSNFPKVLIVSYGMLAQMQDIILNEYKNNIIIVDECHYLKNSHAKRTKILSPLIQSSKRAFLLSGTPALSRPIELFTQLNALNKDFWTSEKDFFNRYCKKNSNTKSNKKSKNKTVTLGSNVGANHTQELHLLLKSTIMIRRLKKDVLSQLPPKTRVQIFVDIQDENLKNDLM